MRPSISLYLAVLVLVVSTGNRVLRGPENNEMHARHLAINIGLEAHAAAQPGAQQHGDGVRA